LRLITFSDLVCAALILSVQVVLVAVAALGVWPTLSPFRLLHPQYLSAALTVFSVALGLLTAPAFAYACGRDTGTKAEQRHRLARAIFFATWQAAVLGFFLLVASRLEPVDSLAIVRVMAVLACTVAFGILMASRWPSAYAGLVFLWAVALPLSCYLLTEIFLDLPAGAMGWNASRPEGAGFYRLVAASLKVSPGTAAMGTLEGSLLGLKDFGWSATGYFVMGASIAGALVYGYKTRPVLTSQSVSTPL